MPSVAPLIMTEDFPRVGLAHELVEEFGVDEDAPQNSTTFAELDSTGGIDTSELLTKLTVGDAVTYLERRVQ